jgi:trans-aconitate methyltransferase
MERDVLKEHFNEVAGGKDFASYEARRWSADDKRKVQQEQTKWFIERSVLPHLGQSSFITELGPGPGTWTKLLFEAAPNAQFLLLDIAQEMLVRARAALPAQATVATKEGDFTSLELPPSTADFFFSSRAIEYVAPRDVAIHSISTHLRSNGRGVLITKMPKPIMNRLSGRTPSLIHRGQWSPDTMRRELEAAGCVDIELFPVSFSFPILHSAQADRFIGHLFQGRPLNPLAAVFAESYGATFRKP